MSAIGAALISAGSSLLGGLIGNNASVKAVKAANQGNMELAKYSYAQNLEQWNRENDYNTPANQMARLKAAGLNPNLMYGDSSAGGTAASSPAFKAPELSAYTGQGALGASIGSSVGDSAMKYLAAQKSQAETSFIETQRLAEQQRVNNLAADLVIKAEDAKSRHMSNDVYSQTMDALVRNANASADRAEIGVTNDRIQSNLYGSMIEKNQAATRLLKSQTKLTDAQVNESVKRLETIAADAALKYAQAHKVRMDANLLDQTFDYVVDRARMTINKIDLDTRRGEKELSNLLIYGNPHPMSGAVGSAGSALTFGLSDYLSRKFGL